MLNKFFAVSLTNISIRLGENRKMLAGLQQLLVDRAGEKDYSGVFSLAILKVCLTLCYPTQCLTVNSS